MRLCIRSKRRRDGGRRVGERDGGTEGRGGGGMEARRGGGTKVWRDGWTEGVPEGGTDGGRDERDGQTNIHFVVYITLRVFLVVQSTNVYMGVYGEHICYTESMFQRSNHKLVSVHI